MVTTTSALQIFSQIETERTSTPSAPKAFLRLEGQEGQKRLVTILESSCCLWRFFQWIDRTFLRKHMYDLEAVTRHVHTLESSEIKDKALKILQGKVQRYNLNHKETHIRTDTLFSERVQANPVTTDSAQVKKALWTYVSEKGRVLFQILARNEGENKEKALVFVEAFLQTEKISIDAELKAELINTVIQVFESKTLPTKKGIRKLNDTTDLMIYKTRGEGACAFHALLGTFNDASQEYVCADHDAKRAQFCIWLRENKTHLPDEIKIVLNDYFVRFDVAPSYFKTSDVTAIRSAMYVELQTKTEQKDRDAIVERFMQDDVVFNAYLQNLLRPDTYLLQEELIAAAICFNIRLILFQPGLGNDNVILCREDFNKELTGLSVAIYYNGFNHFDKAEELYTGS